MMIDVYKSCYQFKEQPFRLSPDCRFSFGHRSYDNARYYLKYAISEGEGIVVVTGAAGTGKTTLISTLISELDADYVRVVTLESTQIQTGYLLESVVEAFGIDAGSNASALWQCLKHFLLEGVLQGKRNVLIVDEAQAMSKKSLEELRLLTNLQAQNRLLLQVFLVGQEALLSKVRAPGMEQLHQRVVAAASLEALDKEETAAYVEHRLRRSGWCGDPEMSEKAMVMVHKFSQGVPRRINLICHRLFLYGGLKNKRHFSGSDVLHVVLELHREGLLLPLSRRS